VRLLKAEDAADHRLCWCPVGVQCVVRCTLGTAARHVSLERCPEAPACHFPGFFVSDLLLGCVCPAGPLGVGFGAPREM